VRAMAAERAAARGGRPLPPARGAVNERYATESSPRPAGDVVAVIPPIAGG
jgi:molybdopterin converting factor small subunit